MDFLLFLLLNFTLFVRPQDFLEGNENLSLYNYALLAALAAGAQKVANRCFTDRMLREPIVVCVLGLVPAIAMSHIAHFDFYSARIRAWDFCKVLVYFFLLTSVVNSTVRIRQFLYAVALFTAITALIAILDFHEVIQVPALRAAQEALIDPMTGERYLVPRLVATGLFNDPNDLAMIAVFCMVISVMALTDPQLSFNRIVWLIPLGILFWTLILTKSRGGLLAFLAAAGVLSYFRLGLWKSMIVGSLLLPVVVLAAAQRATDIGDAMKGEGTANERIELWSCGLDLLKTQPVFGIGAGFYSDQCGLVAHNSFVHTFVELGFVGGPLFLGAYWCSLYSLWRLARGPMGVLLAATPLPFRRMHPFVLAAVLGFAVSQFSLSRPYVIPTVMVFGTASAYCLEAVRQGLPAPLVFNFRRYGEILVVSVAFLIVIKILIRIAHH
ncbi:MAG: O-antigen ligase family protein [Planctomycetes bacterium]|nr:O-antigen ligase family protein [Planctomycetota bacterium]